MCNATIAKLRAKECEMDTDRHRQTYESVKHPYIYAQEADFRMSIDD